MFTKQSEQLNGALQQAGIPPSAADSIVHAIANCAAQLEHRGPVKIQYVPQQARLIDPETFKVTRQPLANFETSDGERRPYRPATPPDEPDEPNDPTKPPPNNTPEPFDPTELWTAIREIQDQLPTIYNELQSLRSSVNKNASDIAEIWAYLRNTTDCPEDEEGMEEGQAGNGN